MSVKSDKGYYFNNNNLQNINEKTMKFELEEVMEVVTRHGKNDSNSDCILLNSYPLSMTLIRCGGNKERDGIIKRLNEFSGVVKGSYWIVLEEVEERFVSHSTGEEMRIRGEREPRNITMLEFFNYNDGFFRTNTAEMVNNIDEMGMMYNYFSHPSSILSMSSENGDCDDSKKGDLVNIGMRRNKASLSTTLRRRRDFEVGNSRSFFGLTFSNFSLGMNSCKLMQLDQFSITHMVKISNIDSLDNLLNELEGIYKEFWFRSSKESECNGEGAGVGHFTDRSDVYAVCTSEIGSNATIVDGIGGIKESLVNRISFFTVLAFNVERNSTGNDDYPNGGEYNNKDVYVLHMFKNKEEYELILRSKNWSDYLLSLMRVTEINNVDSISSISISGSNNTGRLCRNSVVIELSTHRLIYCCNSRKTFEMEEDVLKLTNIKNENSCDEPVVNVNPKVATSNSSLKTLDSGGTVLIKSERKSNSSDLKLALDNSNGSSSTDLDSVTTSINSSSENLTVTDSSSLKRKSMEVIIDDNGSDLSFKEERNSSDGATREDLLLIEKRQVSCNPDYSLEDGDSNMKHERTTALLDSMPHSLFDKEILVSSLDNADFWKLSLKTTDKDKEFVVTGLGKEATKFGSITENDEYYECRDMKYEPYELKRILTEMNRGEGRRCLHASCVYCTGLENQNMKEEYNNAESSDFWCKTGFRDFCEIYKRMGVVRLEERGVPPEEKGEDYSVSWLIREFIGDEVSDVIFCDGVSRRRTTIKGDLRGLRVYLVGDFNNWNKTSHELKLETREIESLNRSRYSNYPVVPSFMRGRVYSIVLTSRDLVAVGGPSNAGLCSFKLRVVTTKRVTDDSLKSTEEEEFETYRLLTYSRNLIPSGIKDNNNNKLLNCLFKTGLDYDESKLMYPLPVCVENGILSEEKKRSHLGIGILEEIIRKTKLSSLYIYEANISCSNGKSGQRDRKDNNEYGTFVHFRKNVLPRVSRGGYNAILFSDILEHSQSYSNYQYPCNYFVPHTEYGTLEEFKELTDECHKRGLLVLIDFNLTFGDITSPNSMLQPCDREVNNSLGSNVRDIGEERDNDREKVGRQEKDQEKEDKSVQIQGVGNKVMDGVGEDDKKREIEKLFIDESFLDLYESFMLTNMNTINPSFFKHTPDVISSLFTFNRSHSRLNLCYVPMLSIIVSSIHYLMTESGVDGFRFTLPDLFEEGSKYPLFASILALINDMVHSIKPYSLTIANELLLRENMQNRRACSELSVPVEYGGMGFDLIWDVSMCSAIQDIAVKNISCSYNNNVGGLRIGRDIVERLISFEDRMKLFGRRILLLRKNKRKIYMGAIGDKDKDNELVERIKDREITDRRKDAVELVCRTIYGIESLETKTVTQNPLRIAMFSWESLHTHLVGGVSPHVSELSASLVRLGHEVHLFTRATGSSYIIKEYDGVLYHECPFQLNSDFVTEITNMCNSFVYHMQRWEDGLTKVSEHFVGSGTRRVKAIKNGYRFNVCHCHDWLAAPVLTSLRRIGNNNRTTIFTVHSTEYGRCGNQSFGGQSKRISDIEREGCHTANRIICVSGVLADEVCRLFGVNRNKIKVIYNGIHCHVFDRVIMNDPGEIKRQLGIGPLEPTFLCVARMVIQKGVDLLVEAVPGILKYRNDTKFIIVGDGHQKDEIERRAHQLGVYNSIRFVGKKSGDDVIRLYKACDAVVVPSRNEPFGIVVLEGWTAGKPVVATTSGGPRDFLTPNVDGYLVEPCKDSIAWGCCEILKNFDHSRWMGSRGRVKAAYSFSWDTIARITSYLYYEQTNTLDSAPSLVLKPNSPVILEIFGEDALHHHMTVFDGHDRSVNSLKVIKLLILTNFAFSKNGILQSMGSEFGNPDSFDFPRPNNGMDSSKLCCRWDLADDKSLRFKHIEFLNSILIRIEKMLRWNNNLNKYGSDYYIDDNIMDCDGDVTNNSNERDSDTVSLDDNMIANNEFGDMFSMFSTEGKCKRSNRMVDIGSIVYNHFSWSNSSVRILLCHEFDKVLVLERSCCTFVFNYSDKYYKNYGFGISNELPQSVLLDTQDERFGGNKKYVIPDYLSRVDKGDGKSIDNNPVDYDFCGVDKYKNPNPDNVCGMGYILDSVSGFRLPDNNRHEEHNYSNRDGKKTVFGGLVNKVLFSSNGHLLDELRIYESDQYVEGLLGDETKEDYCDSGVDFESLSPYRYTDLKILKQTVFLDMAPFSAYILVPFELARKILPGDDDNFDKRLVVNVSVDDFIDSIKCL